MFIGDQPASTDAIAILHDLSVALRVTSLAFTDDEGGIGICHNGAIYIIDKHGLPLLGEPTHEIKLIHRLAEAKGPQIMALRDDGAYHVVAIDEALAALACMSDNQ